MTYGVKINGEDTLVRWGLMLLADVKVEAPKLKEYRVDIPDGDGSLDYSAWTGYPRYSDRKITFTLFAPVPDAQLDELRTELMLACHGTQTEVIFPWDPWHFFRGTLQVGDISGYNSGKIPMTMHAEPYRYERREREVDLRPNDETGLFNEGMPVSPRITTTAETKLIWDGITVILPAGEDQRVPRLVLPRRDTLPITAETEGSVTMRWRVRVL